jgi:hypothetical protein
MFPPQRAGYPSSYIDAAPMLFLRKLCMEARSLVEKISPYLIHVREEKTQE